MCGAVKRVAEERGSPGDPPRAPPRCRVRRGRGRGVSRHASPRRLPRRAPLSAPAPAGGEGRAAGGDGTRVASRVGRGWRNDPLYRRYLSQSGELGVP